MRTGFVGNFGQVGYGLPAPSIAVTSPVDALKMVGESVTITGTCSAGSVVKVYRDGVLYGTPTVIGTNWSIGGWTLANADEGVHSLYATAALHTKTATSATKKFLVLGPSLGERWKSTSGVVQTSNLVDTWTGMWAGNVMSNTGGSARPTYNAADSSFNNKPTIAGDGTAKYLRTTTYAPPRPGTTPSLLVMALKLNAWTSGRRLYGSGASNNIYTCIPQTSSPSVGLFNGSSTLDNNGLTLGSWKRFGAYYSNTVNDYTYCGATKVSTVSAGNNLPSGNFTLFASGLIGLFVNATVGELLILHRDFTPTEWTAFEAYLAAEYVAGMS